jgi:hypothetical protein
MFLDKTELSNVTPFKFTLSFGTFPFIFAAVFFSVLLRMAILSLIEVLFSFMTSISFIGFKEVTPFSLLFVREDELFFKLPFSCGESTSGILAEKG